MKTVAHPGPRPAPTRTASPSPAEGAAPSPQVTRGDAGGGPAAELERDPTRGRGRRLGISVDEARGVFRLDSPGMSYVIAVDGQRELVHRHWGRPIDGVGREGPKKELCSWHHPRDLALREYPDARRGDTRAPAFTLRGPTGHDLAALKYFGYEVLPGKPEIPGRTSSHAEPGDRVSTLILKTRDDASKVRVDLFYSLFPDHDAIARHAEVTNEGEEALELSRVASWSNDFPAGKYRTLQLSGTWSRERQPIFRDVLPGAIQISSRMGVTGHQHNPFLALLSDRDGRRTDERQGEVFAVGYGDSGSFLAEVDQGPLGMVRLYMGSNPSELTQRLERGEAFRTPESIGFYSSEGLGGMSRRAHRLIRERVIRGPWRDRLRGVKVNSWEAVYFETRDPDLREIFKLAADAGAEIAIIDDGWFGERHDDTSSLGLWRPNLDKLPRGLEGIGEYIVGELGMRMGLWFEPEMGNEELREAHPSWFLQVPGYEWTPLRNQYVLDLSQEEVQDFAIASISDVLERAPISYVKWDFNRPMTEIGSVALPPERQGEVQSRYGLGLARVQRALTARFPEVLFEGCASGGGRFTLDQLAVYPQYWTSDDTDGLERLRIQQGTSYFYPAIAMSAHVSDVPNAQVGRTTPLAFRAHVAMCGNFGVELDLRKLSAAERDEVAKHIAYYKEIRHLVQLGDQYRLQDPTTSNHPAVMYVHPDKSEAVVFAFQERQAPTALPRRLELDGLDPHAEYHIRELGRTETGRDLMNFGLELELEGDYASHALHLVRVAG